MSLIHKENALRTKVSPACYICGGRGQVLYKGLKDRLFGVPGEWSINKCNNPGCGLMWINPVPLPEDIWKAYQNYYTHASVIDHATGVSISNSLFRYAAKLLANSTGLTGQRKQLESMYLEEGKFGKLLEIGSGSGDFLARMRAAGWSVEGVDLDPKAAKHAYEKHGVKVHVGSLHAIGLPEAEYDAVTMNHVIEHVHDPVSLLRECFRILKPGGRIVVVTPNIESWLHRFYGQAWLSLDPPRHIHLFSRAALHSCFIKAGFGELDIRTTSARIEGIVRGCWDIKRVGRHDMQARGGLSQRMRALLYQYYMLYLNKKNLQVGEELIVIGQKQ